ncbi:hypothetical protein B4100_2173 [Heyndrickxia coagulans]|nr:hypothetical protein B4100_2173 [Heyndrickxia coagulans]
MRPGWKTIPASFDRCKRGSGSGKQDVGRELVKRSWEG